MIEKRLRKETSVSENQFGFMSERSTMKAILLRRLIERYREEKEGFDRDVITRYMRGG